MNRRFAVDWTGSGWVSAEFNDSIKLDLTRGLNGLVPALEDEARFGVRDQFGAAAEWRSVGLVAQVSLAAFVSGTDALFVLRVLHVCLECSKSVSLHSPVPWKCSIQETLVMTACLCS